MSKICVVDIETTDTAITTKILSIGAAIVDTDKLTVEETFYARLNLEQPGRTESQSTMNWWNSVREEEEVNKVPIDESAYYEAFENPYERLHLKFALDDFNNWLKSKIGRRPKVFGNGCEFDNAILEQAMIENNIKPAWDHGCNQSLRTAVWFGRELLNYDPKYKMEFKGTKHRADDDARHEAEYLISILKEFKLNLPTE